MSDLVRYVRHGSGSNTRYYVHVGGHKVGWVLKEQSESGRRGFARSGGWKFYSTVHKWFEGKLLAEGYATRRDALLEGLLELRTRHLGRVVGLDDKAQDTVDYVPEELLRAAEDQLLDDKYPTYTERQP